jgi:hypothetical protein
MNGAKAEPPPITIKTPINNNTIITGVNHHFFLSLRKFHISLKKSIAIVLLSPKRSFSYVLIGVSINLLI